MGYPKGYKLSFCKDCEAEPRTHGVCCKSCHAARMLRFHHKNKEKQNARSRAYYYANREKALATAAARRAAHPTRNRDWKMRRLYGISAADVSALYVQQEGRCAICAGEFPETGREGLHVDHCHETRKIRGLLCTGCNQGLGRFRDSSARLRAAAQYLERPR